MKARWLTLNIMPVYYERQSFNIMHTDVQSSSSCLPYRRQMYFLRAHRKTSRAISAASFTLRKRKPDFSSRFSGSENEILHFDENEINRFGTLRENERNTFSF